jgi:non-specific serine/threonine protein kinase
MIGQTISHYKILEKLGEGGMGVVYKAEDIKLKRIVALKFFPTDFNSAEEEQTRFLREAQAAAVLNHPNICTIHAIEEHEGRSFIDMEWVDGVTLRENIPFQSIDEAVSFAIQIANGLHEAHSNGIVHRDVKAENIMIDAKNQAKVMDFGVARLKGARRLTKVNASIGTIAYMAPEQIRGKEADPRSDIFAFGILLSEMLTGHRPFRGEHDTAMMYSVLHEEPVPLSTYRSDAPEEIQHVINKALEKNPDDRYQTLLELCEDLGTPSAAKVPAAATQAPQEKAIVVLPFENMSSDKENEYFSDGLTEELIADLSKIKSLRVISRTSAMTLKGTDLDIGTIGRQLNVRYVLEGSVRKAENAVRITAQLIDVATDNHLWAEKYQGTLDDIFDMQENVSRSIVEALKVNLSPEENKRIGEREIPNVHAYECYLKARQEILLYKGEGLERAHKLLKDALRIVGENALLNAGIGYVYWQFVNAGIRADTEYLDIAERYADKVFKMDPESHHGHRLLGLINAARGNPAEAVANLKKALAADPNDPDTLGWLGLLYGFYGNVSAGLPLCEKLLEIDPLTPVTHVDMSFMPWFEGRFDEAAERARKAYELAREHPVFGFMYGLCLACGGHLDEAYTILEEVEHDQSAGFFCSLSRFIRNALQGNKAAALRSVTHDMSRTAKNDMQYSAHMAGCYALINEPDKALKWLANAVERGFINHPFLSRIDPFLKNLHGDERFETLMADVKKRWEAFET